MRISQLYGLLYLGECSCWEISDGTKQGPVRCETEMFMAKNKLCPVLNRAPKLGKNPGQNV